MGGVYLDYISILSNLQNFSMKISGYMLKFCQFDKFSMQPTQMLNQVEFPQ